MAAEKELKQLLEEIRNELAENTHKVAEKCDEKDKKNRGTRKKRLTFKMIK